MPNKKILLAVKSKAIEPLGTMYLSSMVKKSGWDCRICTFTDLTNWEYVSAYMPTVVGYSCMTGAQDLVRAINHELIRQFKHISIVGGPHPTFTPQDFPVDEFDFVVQGEAEQWMADFLRHEECLNYSDINSLPWPDRTDFPNMPIRDFIASRGCPWSHCKYCYNDKFNKMFPGLAKVRVRSVQDVVREVEYVNPKFAYFQDSCFGISIKWLREFSAQFSKLNIPFHAHFRPQQITEERVHLLKDANCASLRMAIESASPRLRTMIGRQEMDNQELIQAAGLLKQYKLPFMLQSILGLPTATIEDDLATLELNIECGANYAWSSIFSPFPGTELGDLCKEKGWYTGDYSDITDCFFDKSVLNFDEEYKEQTYYLQKAFALCVEAQEMPKSKELSVGEFPKLIHRLTRKIGDKRLYKGII